MTLKTRIQIDTQVITKELSKAMRGYTKELDQKLDHQFFNSNWEWPRLTRRDAMGNLLAHLETSSTQASC